MTAKTIESAPDIFEFWAHVPAGANEHPDDTPVLHHVGHRLRRDCLPGPFFGPLRSARVVILTSAPNTTEGDPVCARAADYQALYEQQRTGWELLPSRDEHRSAWNWWDGMARHFRFDLAGARKRVAFVYLSAYKVPGYLTAKDHKVIAALPSTQACVSWARSVLFPAAERGDRVVVVVRPWWQWGIERADEPYGVSLFAPKFVRKYMRLEAPWERLVAAIAKALAEPMR
jgi:hypothetical protein